MLPLAKSSIRESDTVVQANNGDIIVIGGLMKTDRQEIVSKVPLLGDIPWVGEAFTNRRESNRKVELVILLKPTVVEKDTWQKELQRSSELLDKWYPQGLIRDDAPVEHSFSHVVALPGCCQSALPDGGGAMSLIRGCLRLRAWTLAGREHVSEPLRTAGGSLRPDPEHRFLLRPAPTRRPCRCSTGRFPRGGFIKVTGEVGTGKTLLCRKLLSELGSEACPVRLAWLPNPISLRGAAHGPLALELGLTLAGRASWISRIAFTAI